MYLLNNLILEKNSTMNFVYLPILLHSSELINHFWLEGHLVKTKGGSVDSTNVSGETAMLPFMS